MISRQLPLLYESLKEYPSRMILPHRLMVYSNRIMTEVHNKNISVISNEWMKQSCCLPRQNCVERKTWLPLADPKVCLFNSFIDLQFISFLNFIHLFIFLMTISFIYSNTTSIYWLHSAHSNVCI